MMPYTLLPAGSGTDQVSEWIRLGLAAVSAKSMPDAERHFRRALRLDPNNPTATANLSIVLVANGNLNEGLLAIERAAIYDGVEPLIASNRAMMNLEADRLDEARSAAEHALSLSQDKPRLEVESEAELLKRDGYLAARLAYAIIAAASGQPAEALPKYQEMLEVDPQHGAAGPNSCFMQSLMAIGPAELREQRRKWHAANAWKGKFWPHRNEKVVDKVLNVGYVSGDFKSHSAAMMFAHVVLNHDKTRIQPFLYSSMPTNAEHDDLTALFMQCGEWRDVVGKSDEDVEEMIGKDEIDILVDLSGQSNGGRLPLFTRKPAPVQVTAWGFAHGTGCPEIDYFLADPIAVPESERQHYAERIWDVPCIVTYRPPVEYGIRATSPLPFARNEYITFGSFSRYEKLSDECLDCFRQILERVPNSKLYLKDHCFRRPYAIRRVLKALGVDRSRVIFGLASSHPEHLLEYQSADLMLDTMPHGAGVVSLEALYAGVPIITKYGGQPAGRTASSVLTAMGRTDWIARSNEEYVEKAVEWAGRTAELSAARKTLRQELLDSPVVKDYPRVIEEAYRSMWKAWCKT